MTDVDVRPEGIHTAARKVDDAGQDWGESIEQLKTDLAEVGDPYGDDELGTALREMYDVIGPTALTYLTETGFCVVETAVAMNQIAKAYTVVEEHNANQAAEVDAVIDSLGDP